MVAMPDLDGLSEDEATAKLQELKFEKYSAGPEKTTEECGETPTVVAQTPAPNTQIAVDQPVTYTLCKAPDKVRVPDLKGSTRDAAEKTLTDLGLDPDFDEVDSNAPEGQVVEVEKAGQQVDPKTKITVKISKGNLVAVPNVVGRTQDAAEALLGAAGFEVRVEEVAREGEAGTVVEQNPAANRSRPRGSTVTIVVIEEQAPDPGNSGDPDPDETTPPIGGNGAGENGGGLGGILDRT